MASKTVIELIDDIDGSPATETIPFSLDGVAYEIDLSDVNAKTLREGLTPYINAGRRVGGRKNTGAKTSTANKVDTKAVREWAKSHGLEVGEYGRIPRSIIERYEAAQ